MLAYFLTYVHLKNSMLATKTIVTSVNIVNVMITPKFFFVRLVGPCSEWHCRTEIKLDA